MQPLFEPSSEQPPVNIQIHAVIGSSDFLNIERLRPLLFV